MRTALFAAALFACVESMAQTPKPPAGKAPAAGPVLQFPPLKPIPVPSVATFKLSNGIRLYLLEDHELPVVNGVARIRTGNLFDPADKVGLATIAGMVLRTGGTKSKTGDQLDQELEDMAARVESGIGETSGSVSFFALKEKAGPVMEIFRDVLTSPEFRQDRIELARTQIRSGISRRNDDAGAIAQREFTNRVYGPNTPYGWQMEYATVDRITRGDLQSFHSRYFFPANIMLAVWGDFDTAAMKDQVEKLFAGWNVKQPPVPPFPPVQAQPAPGVFLASKQDVTQTFFTLGHLGGELRDPDYAALEIMADILGGGFRSRLVQRVRSRMGAAYNVSAAWAADYDHPGLFEISGSTKSLSTLDTLKAVREEVERIRTTEVSGEELETARQTALNSLVFAFDTKAKTLGRLLTYEYYGYPRDFIQRYQKALAAVTKADVLRAAQKHINPQNLTIVAVGNPVEFGQPLTGLGLPVLPIDLTIPEQERAKTTPESAAQGKALLSKVQQAVGGAEKLAAVKDMVEQIEFQVDPAAGGMRVEQTDRWIAPNHFRQDSLFPAGKVAAYSDGQTGWIVTPQGSGPLAGPQLQQVRGDLFRLYFRLLLSDRIAERTVNYIGDGTLEISGPSGEAARLVVDEATGMPRKVIYESVHVSGPPITVEDQYVHFQEVDGIKVPRQITIVQGGRKFAEVTVKDYKLNAGLSVDELSKRP
ncbi:MAG: M16 family metallopeptidase [Bryobacteraceae bacterium]